MKTKTPEYRYRYNLIKQIGGSEKYGNCEICGKHCDTIYSQSESREYTRPLTNTQHWIRVSDHWGHVDCLKMQRKG